MNTVGDRIKKFRILLNLTQDELAEKMGESSGRVIYTWEKGTGKPDYQKLVKLCEILNVSADELLGCNHSEKPTASEWIAIKKYRALDERGKQVVDNVMNTEYEIICNSLRKKKARILKLDYFNIPASAGTGIFLDSEEAEEILVYDSKVAEDADFVIRVSGDSMEPVFQSGDHIAVRRQSAIDVGDIGIFVVNGDVFVKELGNGTLISRNENYKPIKISPDDSFYCCGLVLGIVETI